MFSGIRHYWVEPDPTDRRKPEFNRIWPWKDMNVGDYVVIPTDQPKLINSGSVSAYRYGKRNGEIYRTGFGTGGFYIWRSA